MDDKDRLEAYLTLYRQQMERAKQTQDIEWKGNFGIWALLAAACYFAAKEHPILPPWRTAAVLTVLVLIHACWLFKVHGSYVCDKQFWVHYRGKVLELLQQRHHQTPFNRSLLTELIWLLLEVGISALLAIEVAVLLYARTGK